MGGFFSGGLISDSEQEGGFGTDNDTNNVFENITTDTTTEGAIIDTQGFSRAMIFHGTGTVTDGDYTFSVTHGDDSALSDEATMEAPEIQGSFAAYTADTDDNKDDRVEVILSKRYLRLEVVSDNTSSGAWVWALVVLYKPTHGAKTK